MMRKSITTGQGAVTCDVCGRSLLRGEHADVFLSGGSRRMVCDLCVARAAHEGWIREGVDDSLAVRPRDERRSLLSRLRLRGEGAVREVSSARRRNGVDAAGADSAGAPAHPDANTSAYGPALSNREPRHVRAVPTNADLKTARALEVFNASEYPRTVAGVARSLGAPFVVVRPSELSGSIVSILVGWELCWYRYEVDLADEASGVRMVAQGEEVTELDAVDQIPNAAADTYGELHLAAASTSQ
ncbi:MAG TPA: hypothetical protein VGY97_00490 [Solirubrobacteraceae bacterium]|jgi:hypothetical protein|nr:hypothetical protein [Solirubrobacteraceae bacterium]